MILRLIGIFLISISFLVACDGQVRSGSENLGLQVIPADSSIVASVNIQTLLNDPLFKELSSKGSDFQKGKEELQKIGIDINKDIKNVYFGTTEALFEEGSKSTADFVAFIEADYDEAKVLDFIKKKNSDKFTEKKVKGFTVISSNEADVNAEFAFYKNKAIVVSRNGKIAKYLDLLDGNGKSIVENDKISKNIPAVSSNNLIWGLVEYKESMKQLSQNKLKVGKSFPNLDKEMQKVQLFSFGIDKKEDLNIQINQLTTDAESAKALSTEMNNALALAKLFLGGKLSQESMSSLKVEPQGNSSVFSFSILKKDLDKLKETAASQVQ